MISLFKTTAQRISTIVSGLPRSIQRSFGPRPLRASSSTTVPGFAKHNPKAEVRPPKSPCRLSFRFGTEPGLPTYLTLVRRRIVLLAPRQIKAKADSGTTLPVPEQHQASPRKRHRSSWMRNYGKRWRDCLERGARQGSSMRTESPWL
jgi:hypothetical protein